MTEPAYERGAVQPNGARLPTPLAPPLLRDVRDTRRVDGRPAAALAEPASTGTWLAAWTPAADIAVTLGMLFVCVLLAEGFTVPRDAGQFLSLRVSLRNVLLVAGLLAWVSAALRVTGAYDLARSSTSRELVANTLAGCTIGAAPAVLLPWLAASGRLSAATGVFVWAGLVLGVAAIRAATRGTVGLRRGAAIHIVIAGTGPRARALWNELRHDRTVRYRLVAVTDTSAALVGKPFGDTPGVPVGQFAAFMMHAVVDEVFVALPVRSCYDEIERVLSVCEIAGVHSEFLADPVAPKVARPRAGTSGAYSAIAMHVVVDDWRLVAKRAIDVVGAAVGLLILAPVLFAIAAGVRTTSRGPVVFTQDRYGLRKRRFRMYKFRTMVPDAERLQSTLEAHNEAGGPVFKIARDPRVTTFGAFLRRTSLDELPQLWNVLRGDMSLVGPRPLPVRDVTRFDEPWLMRRFSVRPGLTCIWQISGRSGIGFNKWIELDLQYIDNWSLALDLNILVRTVPAVLRGTGAS